MLDPEEWARQQWGGVELGDRRRQAVAVEVGRRKAKQPAASLPEQMGSWGRLKAAYRLLNNEEVTMEALLEGHWQETRERAREAKVVLFTQDTTELDYTAHRSKKGLGPIGDGRGRGLLLHSTLAVLPESGEVLGVAYAQVVLRQEKPAVRPKWNRTPEGQLWQEAAIAVGQPPEGSTWVHVGDRGSDIFEFMAVCLAQGKHFLIRAFRNRRLAGSETSPEEAGAVARLLEQARALAEEPGSAYEVTVAARGQQPGRRATLVLAWSEVTLALPQQAPPEVKQYGPLSCWVVRAWEPKPPEGAEPVEWILLTSYPVISLAEAQRVVFWYTFRWLCEDFHQCLKTGCRIEQSQLDDGEDIQRLLGFDIPIAVRLLQLRQAVRVVPEVPASSLVDPLLVLLLAKQLNKEAATMTVTQFWRGVAQLGGHLGRRRDGPPGWRTLWRGWRLLASWADGARLLGLSP